MAHFCAPSLRLQSVSTAEDHTLCVPRPCSLLCSCAISSHLCAALHMLQMAQCANCLPPALLSRQPLRHLASDKRALLQILSLEQLHSVPNSILCRLQAAARAAERRARDNVWCPCDHGTHVGYNSDDDVIILDDLQQHVQTPATRLAQTDNQASCAPSSFQPAAPARDQKSSSNEDSVVLTHQPRCVLLQPAESDKSGTAQTNHQTGKPYDRTDKAQHRQCADEVKVSPEHTVRADLNCTKPSSMLAEQGPDSCELVDLTADEAEQQAEQQPGSKRMRLHHSTADGAAGRQCLNDGQGKQGLSQHLPGLLQPACANNRPPDQWACRICTLLNAGISLQCNACGQARPAEFQTGCMATCLREQHNRTVVLSAGTAQLPMQAASSSWSCKFCSVVNASAHTHCCACDQWRYSHGIPFASRPTL